MLLSIVIVNYRSWSHLADCLESLLADAPGPAREIVVVDNDSADSRFDSFAAGFPGVRFHTNDGNHGFAHGCNLGAAQARGELLLFLNPDTLAPGREIDRLVRLKLAHPEVAILSARQIGRDGTTQKAFDAFPTPWTEFPLVRALARRFDAARYPDPRAEHEDLVYCDWVSGSLLLIAASDFQALGGFSTDYWMYMEDVDLCLRARGLGKRVAFTPQACFVHHHGGASRQTEDIAAFTKAEVVISRHVYVSKHFRGAERFAFHAVLALRRAAGLVASSGLDLLTLRRVRALRIRTATLRLLLAHYARAWNSGSWLSARSVNRRKPN